MLVHGYQGGLFKGAKQVVERGVLLQLSSSLNITAAAVSQPGFGASDGPADFCGPRTQQAIMAALSFLKEQPSIDPDRIVLYGYSRGAIASAMVATQVPDLEALILSSGVYDLKAAFDSSSGGVRQAIQNEAGLSNEAFLARSALYHTHKIHSNILILHGRQDDRAPVSQAEIFAETLSDAGVPVTLSLFECGHRIPLEYSQGVLRPFLEQIFAPSALGRN
ncbi:alpha/beta hydrolase family protein [Nisaea nitritireducens]|uniref:alpha/beta hydrolase family protein n=1 Tax=Nisaea nitritireducens TaxID=568392 RepID=UPI001D013C7F|nr:prolyl oligopeptidase family serine peptidase [Nisaea nitritireducens]